MRAGPAMNARFWARLRNEPIAGLIVLTLAGGFLMGVLAANVRDGTPETTTAGAVAAADTELGAGQQSTGTGDAGAATGATGESTAGGTGTASGGATTGGGTSSAASATGATTANVRGVTDNTIKLGIACINLGALRNIPQYDAGDQQKEFESVVDGWKRAGLLPVNGRNIELVFRCFDVLSPEDQRATAVELVRDKQVFAVVAHCCFRDGAEIVAREFRTPLVGVDPVLESGYQRSAPFLFSLGAAMDREARNFVQWAKDLGFTGKKWGFYYYEDNFQPEIVRAVRAELAKVGNTNSVTMSTDQSVAGPKDGLAVQRFSAERVEVAVVMTAGIGFTQAAASQRYKPQYLIADFGQPTITDTTAQPYDQDNFDGALGFTQQRVGEWRIGPVSKQTKQCEDDYARYSGGERIEGPKNESQWGALLYACDVMNLAFQGLQKAGRDLTPATFVRALETVTMEGGRYANLNYSATKHHGGNSFRTVKWDKGCKCWRIQDPAFRPFPVP
jgi:hypothetical protein